MSAGLIVVTAIYPVDGAIPLFNNWLLISKDFIYFLANFVVGDSDLSTLVMNKKRAVVSDDCLNHADERFNFGSNTVQHHHRASKSKMAARNSTETPASQADARPAVSAGNEKTTDAVDGEGKVIARDSDSAVWSQHQQKQLEIALQQYPKTVADRWTCIAQTVPGKTKVRK